LIEGEDYRRRLGGLIEESEISAQAFQTDLI
jgi:hypothetical protein